MGYSPHAAQDQPCMYARHLLYTSLTRISDNLLERTQRMLKEGSAHILLMQNCIWQVWNTGTAGKIDPQTAFSCRGYGGLSQCWRYQVWPQVSAHAKLSRVKCNRAIRSSYVCRALAYMGYASFEGVCLTHVILAPSACGWWLGTATSPG